MKPITVLPPGEPMAAFPPVAQALDYPNGLLAMGGDLSPRRLMYAYRKGIFPWFSEDQPILWWCPDPRAVIVPQELHISRSLNRILKQERFSVTHNRSFAEVVAGCAAPRSADDGTWITPAMQQAYLELHAQGHAHSVEVWREGCLVGGLYGVAVDQVFCAESMFSRESNASKVALVHLCRHLIERRFALIDCQMPNEHLLRMGAKTLSRQKYLKILGEFN
ncbi:leucyl/phenylalanyl-tRNA--protein transferase [Ectothiorhodosinus mongolicus]|uniref:Leucyl/phenylalanyl-tRNA--protein transferase n=1 Tax=Ectothiorhodosinus mongolicus TaxID=233100 RepID=A0A1R3VM78_9GAMM|nr:leucyl/phenylalanyl-tRNA--protein transferase [Ectothiorhodosinus mongolicus]SIT65604.1 leucyl/phenylalanyl-tRNA--protein transferase [Ectothiorhodosinus mongolicus]